MSRDQLRASALRYIKEIYSSHREQDMQSWEVLIEVLMDYTDESIRQHHPEEYEDDFTE